MHTYQNGIIMYNNKLKRGGALSEWHCKNLEKKSKKLSPKVFQIDQFNMILYHRCRYIDHYPCYWKIPQHVVKQRKTTQNVLKMKKDTKMKKLPDFSKNTIILALLMLKIYPAKNLFRRSNSDKIF